MKLYNWFQSTLKAHAAGVSAAVALLIADLNGLKQGQTITLDQWYALAGTYLGVGAVVHSVPNTVVATVVDPADVLAAQLPDDGSDSEV